MEGISYFLIGLIATIIIESIVYCLFIRKDFFKLLGYSFLINSLTNPLANLFFGMDYNFFFIEFLVFFAELFLVKGLLKIKYGKALLISFIANLLTMISGFFFFLIA